MTNIAENYNRVLISNIFAKTNERVNEAFPITDEKEYIRQAKIRNKNNGGICEIVGLHHYVKPYFDMDAKFDKPDDFNPKRLHFKDVSAKINDTFVLVQHLT
jgi:hypothetical protein